MLHQYLAQSIPEEHLRSKVVEVLRREHTKLQLVGWMATPAGRASFEPVVAGVKDAVQNGRTVGAGNSSWMRPGERAAVSAAAATVVTKETMGERLWFACGEEVELKRELAKPVVGILLSNFSLSQLDTWFNEGEIVPVIEAVARMVRDAMQGGEDDDEEVEEKDKDEQHQRMQREEPKRANVSGNRAISSKADLGNRLWLSSQENRMDVSIAKKVVGIILSSFTEAQITSFYENGQVSQVLVGVAAKVEAAMAKPQSPVKNAADEAAHEKRDDIEAQASGRLLNRALKGVLEQPPPSQLRREDKKMDKESKKTVSNSSLSHQANVWVPKATLFSLHLNGPAS